MGRPAIDLTGQRFGMLTVIKRAEAPSGSGIHARWVCQCDCGNTTTVLSSCLRKGQQSCGCKLVTDHYRHGDAGSRLYNVWNNIKQRCNNKKSRLYKYYGGRGISVCEEWENDYLSFKDWAIHQGYSEDAPRGLLTVDRINNDGNYCPDNCRLVDMKVQSNNRRKRRKKWN